MKRSYEDTMNAEDISEISYRNGYKAGKEAALKEADIELKLRTMVESYGGRCLKWVCPGWAGVPDRIVLLPGGKIFFVETKRPRGGVIAPLQSWWQERLTQLGFLSVFVSSQADIKALDAIICGMLARGRSHG